jgi:hypothetical protein
MNDGRTVLSSNEFDGGFNTVSDVGPANLSVYKGAKLGSAHSPRRPHAAPPSSSEDYCAFPAKMKATSRP